jgi:hypothetical protein
MKKFYLAAMAVGAAAPLYLIGGHFAAHGFGLSEFLSASFPNPAASGLVTDLLLSAAVGLTVFGREAKRLGMGKFWMVVAGTFLIGFSFGMPLYFYLKESRAEKERSGQWTSSQRFMSE